MEEPVSHGGFLENVDLGLAQEELVQVMHLSSALKIT